MPDVPSLRAPVPRRWTSLVHALVVEADDPGELMLVGVTAPGFAWLLVGWLGVFGFSEAAAQALPFVLGLLAPVGLYLVTVPRLRPSGALMGAILLATAPMHVTYATRVKPFTLSSACTVGLRGLGFAVVEDPRSRRRWWGLSAVSIAALIASASTAVVAAGVFAAGLVAAFRTGGRSAWRWVAGPATTFAAFAAVWWFTVVRMA